MAFSSTAPNRYGSFRQCVTFQERLCGVNMLIPPGSGVPGGSGGHPDQTERRDKTAARALQRPSR